MEFQEFIDEIKEALTSRFSESMPGTTIEQQEVKKLEGNSYTALSVRPAGNFIGINLDMEHLYEGLENDVSFDELVQYAEDRVFAGLEKTPFFKLDQMPDYDTAKKQLVVELAGMTADPYMLAHIPHKNIEDMTMVYRLQIAKFDDNTATILVTNSLMQQWGVTAEQLHQDAMESSAKLRPFQIKTMAQIMEEMFGGEPGGSFMLPDDAAPPMYIVTNEDRARGSAALFYPEMTDVCARMPESTAGCWNSAHRCRSKAATGVQVSGAANSR